MNKCASTPAFRWRHGLLIATIGLVLFAVGRFDTDHLTDYLPESTPASYPTQSPTASVAPERVSTPSATADQAPVTPPTRFAFEIARQTLTTKSETSQNTANRGHALIAEANALLGDVVKPASPASTSKPVTQADGKAQMAKIEALRRQLATLRQ